MTREKILRLAELRCDNCCFSTFATGTGRAALICRQKKSSVGRWYICSPLDKCQNFYPSRAASTHNNKPRLIPLTRGQFAIVDAEDYPRLGKYIWFAEGRSGSFYAVRKEKGKSIKMHRQITNAPDHLVVDHIDHNGLNNRKRNLRVCTFAENCRNLRNIRPLDCARDKPKTSRYKGVCWNKRNKKWAAAIRCKNKTYHLGYFHDEIEAATAYDRAAHKYHREFANLNLPELSTKGKKTQNEHY
ncbi:MAG: hypothetical protein A2167_04600 [Planctomycetes bacterium RBG_13_46_10]|nr:MAG: hypothetical protein A2167_04600 [Planctomycetes bacterium RBG_13_46_10]